MTIIGLRVNPGSEQTLVTLRAVNVDNPIDIPFEFDTVASTDITGTTNPPIEPPTGNSTDPLDPTFDYLTLGRVTTFPQTTLTINVCDTDLVINGVSYGHLFVSGDFAYTLAGSIRGGIQLSNASTGASTNTAGIPRPASEFAGFPTVRIGDTVLWTQTFQDATLTVCECVVTEIPKVATDSQGISTVTIKIGGTFELLRNRNTRVPSLYCGQPPETAGEAAGVYADVNNFPETGFPAGHFLRESINGFTTEDAYGFLQALYNPSNTDVFEDPRSNIRAFPRPTFNPNSFAALDHSQVIEVNTNTRTVVPSSRMVVYNRYRRDDGFPSRRETYRTYSDNFDGTPGDTPVFNGSPVQVWFLGGSTYTDHVVDFIGETEVFHEEKTYGYIPTAALLYTADINDRCDPSGIDSQFALITTRTRATSFVTDPQTELSPIWKEQDFLEGYYTFNGTDDRGSGPEDTVEILFGNIANRVEEFTNTPQVDPSICPQNYISLVTSRTLAVWGRTEAGEYRILESETDSYSTSETSAPVNPVGDFFGIAQSWVRRSTRGRYSEDLRRWETFPVPTTTEAPPNTNYLTPIVVDVVVSGEVSIDALEDLYGDREGLPLQGRFCYTIDDCETFAERILREEAGLHLGLLLVVPYSFPYRPGHSIRFTDRTGETNDYIVHSVELNQTGAIATKTVLLMRIFD